MTHARYFPATPLSRPRMPDTPQRAQLGRQRTLRQIVFGVQDGVLTALGIVTGVGAGTADHATIVLTGLVSVVVGGISMGVGEFIGGRTERQVLDRALRNEMAEMRSKPFDEFNEQVGFYRQKGFTQDEAEMIVRRLERNPDIWVHEMMRDEFGIDPREIDEGGIGPSIAMMASFAGGGLIPILPFLLNLAGIYSLALAALALFTLGCTAGVISARRPWLNGLELVAAGGLVFAASYGAGHFIPALFGRGPIAAGG